jgi:RNA polymerase sigma-70 factor, ECF subfamily
LTEEDCALLRRGILGEAMTELDSMTPAATADESRDERLATALEAARAGDHAGFADLYRETQPRLLRYAASLVGQDAEDVTAEAWLQIARDLPRFSGDVMGFRGWTATIVRNRSFDHLRSMARRPTTPLEEYFLDRPSDRDTEGAAAENLTTAAALKLIATLPPDQAEAVLLRTVIGLDAPAAAAILGKRPGAVRVAAHRGLKALARVLDEAQRTPPEDGQ